MTTRVAVVGAGAMAREHVRAFASVADVAVVGIHSRTRARAAALAGELRIPLVCSSVAELHERSGADLVVVAVPELSARDVSEACFAFPWGVLLEKPAGYDLADAKAILASAQALQRRVWVGLNRRFLSSTQAVLADLRDTPAARFVHVQDQQNLAGAAALGHPPEVVANWMFANSIHVVDYLCLLGRGPVKNVRRLWPWKGAESAVVLAAVEFQSGDRGVYEGIWQGPGPWAVTVTTPARRWELRPLEQAAFQNAGERRLQQVDIHAWDKEFKPGFRFQAQAVIDALRGKPSEAPTLEQAMATMRLVADIFQSNPG
jgi:predicted dehydrogenase